MESREAVSLCDVRKSVSYTYGHLQLLGIISTDTVLTLQTVIHWIQCGQNLSFECHATPFQDVVSPV